MFKPRNLQCFFISNYTHMSNFPTIEIRGRGIIKIKNNKKRKIFFSDSKLICSEGIG